MGDVGRAVSRRARPRREHGPAVLRPAAPALRRPRGADLRLSPGLRRHIAAEGAGFEAGGYGDLAIHSRRAGEGGYNWELYVNGNRRTCRGHVSGPDQGMFCDTRTMKGNCAVCPDLDYQIKAQRALRERRGDYRFVLASNGTHDWDLDYRGQFVMANNTAWLRSL